MTVRLALIAALVSAATLVSAPTVGLAQERAGVEVVGSSTVYPFVAAVAARFEGAGAPSVRSTGTGGGFRIFCAGLGPQHPDITGASRPMKPAEREACRENGVEEVIELRFGFDGLVFAESVDGPTIDLTREQIYQALAFGAGEPFTWAEIDPALPDTDIQVFGPPPLSGTRDALLELALEPGCESAGGDCEAVAIRDDGAYVAVGEDDTEVVARLTANPDAVGVFGYSYLQGNLDRLKSAKIDGVAPTFDTIASGEYPLSRSLFVYVKAAHVDLVADLRPFVAALASDAASGAAGYLTELGLIPLADPGRATLAETVAGL